MSNKESYNLIVVATLFFSTMFLSVNIFVESAILSKWYAFIGGIIICLIFSLFSQRKKLKIDRLLLVLGIFISYILIHGILSGMQEIKFLLFINFYLLLLLFRLANYNHHHIAMILVVVSVLQALYGILQFTGIFSVHTSFKLLGSFDNPAGFAACLVVGYPFCFTLWKTSGAKRYFGIISAIIILIAILISDSRAGIIAVLVASIVCLFHKIRSKINLQIFLPTVLILFVSIGILLFLHKKDSAIGRLLIWKNSIAMIIEKPLLGHGANGFTAKYMSYQAKYFEENTNHNFSQLADNISHPFNEILLLSVNYGLLGVILVMFLLVVIMRSEISETSRMILVSICTFGCFSYPLRYGFVLAVLAYCLSGVRAKNITTISTGILYRLTIGLSVAGCSILLIKDVVFEYKWGCLVKSSGNREFNMVYNDYSTLYENCNRNYFFLYNYSATLACNDLYINSNNVMCRCVNYMDDYNVQLLLADNYLALHDYDRAVKHYQKAAHMIPNRFTPLYGLWQSYKEQGETNKSIEIGNQILTKEVKIPSEKINKYRNDILLFIKDCKQSELLKQLNEPNK